MTETLGDNTIQGSLADAIAAVTEFCTAGKAFLVEVKAGSVGIRPFPIWWPGWEIEIRLIPQKMKE